MVAPHLVLTQHPVLSLDIPLVFAHRGGSKLRPENTLVAFDHGLALGADGLEFDVRLSRDGVPMVHHDETLDRTTSGRGPLTAHTAATLEQLDAGYHFRGLDGESFRAHGCRIPRLQDVLVRYPGIPLVIELKGDNPEIARAAVAAVRQAGAISRVCFGGFDDGVMRAARAQGTDVTTSAAKEEIRWFLYRSWLGVAPRQVGYGAFQVPESAGRTRVVSPRFVRAARRAGLPVHVWTVDAPPDMERLLEWGVRGLISDRPDLAAQVVRRWRAAHPRA
jgi:glycerophosphoryl diester phosphodiesterase